MLCNFCSSIDLDQLATPPGYKHHSSCADLHQSAKNGCESCQLIWDSQWVLVGGILGHDHDLGGLDRQIVARVVNQQPGHYKVIRFGQEARFNRSRSRRIFTHGADGNEDSSIESHFLWCFLELTTKPDDRSSNYIRFRYLEQRPAETWLHSASGWLTECLASHGDCSHQVSSPARTVQPTRVIDVGPADGSATPLLHICGDEVQEWVTLSHCWGRNPPLKTTMHSFSDHKRALPLAKLPRLFHDAILITRGLGYRYLWIDSLCIVQDSREDWLRESSKMGNIYKHCVFMISADNCRDSQDAILGYQSQISYVQQGCYSSKAGFDSVMYTYMRDRAVSSKNSHLQSRAWALQEQVLSPRTLHWRPCQLYWTCRTIARSEEDPWGAQPSHASDPDYTVPTKTICLSGEQFQIARQKRLESFPRARDCEPLLLWYELVMQFSAREITFEEDTFPAVSGLAKEVKRLTGDHYKAGIWTQDFHNGLLWSTNGDASYLSDYVAPSWSWAAIKRGTSVQSNCFAVSPSISQYLDYQEFSVTNIAEILETDIVYASGDKFGPVLSGKLRMIAPYKLISSFGKNQIRLQWQLNDEIRYRRFWSIMQPSNIAYWLDTSAGKLEDERVPERAEGAEEDENGQPTKYQLQILEAAILTHIASVETSQMGESDMEDFCQQNYKRTLQHQNWALILEPVIGDSEEWRRIGIARIADDLIDQWERREFTII